MKARSRVQTSQVVRPAPVVAENINLVQLFQPPLSVLVSFLFIVFSVAALCFIVNAAPDI